MQCSVKPIDAVTSRLRWKYDDRLLWHVAAVVGVSAIEQSEGCLFGAPSSLYRVVCNIEGKNLVVSFGLACHLFLHGIHPYESFAPARSYKNRSCSDFNAVTDGTTEARRISRGTDADQEKGRRVGGLKLVQNKLEQHVGGVMFLDLDQKRSVAATAVQTF
jgi:hypothetical protein